MTGLIAIGAAVAVITGVGAGIGIGVAYKFRESTYVLLSVAAAGMIGA